MRLDDVARSSPRARLAGINPAGVSAARMTRPQARRVRMSARLSGGLFDLARRAWGPGGLRGSTLTLLQLGLNRF